MAHGRFTVMVRSLSILLVAALAWPACACSLPVFRSALETWEADRYPAVVFSQGLLSTDAQALLKSLQKGPSNLSVTVVDVDKPASPDALKLWQAHGSPALPWLAASYFQGRTVAWTGALDAAGLETLLDSPARKQLLDQLLGGVTAVWVLLESGDAARDDKVAEFLQKQSVELSKRLKLAVGPDDPQLRSGVPLKLEFSVVRVARTAPEEKFFVAQLLQPALNPQPDNLESVQPMVIPVFGRGRALPAIAEKDLLPKALSDAAGFLISACSCTAKDLTPGTNLLIAADWETELMTGKNQHIFSGTFYKLSDDLQKLSPDVIGRFTTNDLDKRAGRTYLVKVANGNKTIHETLQRNDGKEGQVTGKLQDISPDGGAKYLIISAATDISATPPSKSRRKRGGL
jgi:hypothetical protein